MFPEVSPTGADKSKYLNSQKNGSFQNAEMSSGSNMQFGKIPSSVKSNFNISFDAHNPELIYSPKTTNMPFKPTSSDLTQSRTSSYIQPSSTQSILPLVQLEFQLSSLKSQNKLMKQQYQATISRNNAQRQTEFNNFTNKIQQLNELSFKDKVKAQTLSEDIVIIEGQRNELRQKLNHSSNLVQDITRKFEDTTKQMDSLKQELKKNRIQLTEVMNKGKYLENDMNAMSIRLKNTEERSEELKGKEDHWKNMIMTMSQQKTLLNNRISQMLEQQAKLENAEVISKLHQSRNESVNPANDVKTKEMAKQIQYLKSRINEILNQQEAGSLKMIYETKMANMERQIQQLKHRYQSPEANVPSHDKTEQQWKKMLDEKNRQIIDLKNVINTLQSKTNQLNKQIEIERSKKSTLNGNSNDVEINNLKTQIKNQKRALQLSDEKIKYLITESRKKDDFLKQYLSTSINKGNEDTFVQDFFKKYSYEIPSDGFSRLAVKDTQTIHDLEEKVKSLTNRMYQR